MLHRFIILAIFSAILGAGPAFADDTETSETQADVIVEDDTADIEDAITAADWCPTDGTMPANTSKAELCQLLQEVEALKQDYAQAAEDKYTAAKENEQSLANRLLTGATVAATSVGAMELARGLAEQKADKAAETEMNAYLSTFQCKIGTNGPSYRGGAEVIETPGANQLIQLYQEYTNLADSLKSRKDALGLQPGLEAEAVLDKAGAGLYDDVGHGIENGAYASLYRASKGNETDMQRLADEKSASNKRVVGGAIATGVGIVGGMIANSIINKGARNKNQELRDKQEQLKSKFEELSKQLIQKCNDLINGHKQLVTSLTSAQLSDPSIAAYKQAVEAAKPIADINEIKDSKFCR